MCCHNTILENRTNTKIEFVKLHDFWKTYIGATPNVVRQEEINRVYIFRNPSDTKSQNVTIASSGNCELIRFINKGVEIIIRVIQIRPTNCPRSSCCVVTVHNRTTTYYTLCKLSNHHMIIKLNDI